MRSSSFICVRANQIVIRRIDLEIHITIDLVGQKAHRQLTGHHLQAQRQALELRLRQQIADLGKEAARKFAEQIHIQIDFARIRLVFVGGRRAIANRVAVIIQRTEPAITVSRSITHTARPV